MDRISPAPRWRTCVHEAGHVVMAQLTGTPVVRACAYRHYSTASLYEQYGYALVSPHEDEARQQLVESAGAVAEHLIAGCSVRQAVRCGIHELTDDDRILEAAYDIVAGSRENILRVASVLRDACGPVSGAVLLQAIG